MEQRPAKKRHQVVFLGPGGWKALWNLSCKLKRMKTQTDVKEEGNVPLIIKERNVAFIKKMLCKKNFKVGQATPKKQGPGPGNAEEQMKSWPWGAFRLCFESPWWLLWEHTLWAKGHIKGAWSHLERVARWHQRDSKTWGDTSEVRH